MAKKLKVLIVEDSKIFQRFLSEGLSNDPGLDVVGIAGDAFEARDMIMELQPDVITLDLGLPGFDGVDFLDRIMKYNPLPVVIVSASAGTDKGVQALKSGAFDVVPKPSADPQERKNMLSDLSGIIRAAVKYPPGTRRPGAADPLLTANTATNPKLNSAAHRIIAVGSSTGGPEALEVALMPLPPNAPGIVIAQHMPAGFTASLAQTLDRKCAMSVREARTGDRVEQGTILVAPGGRQTRIVRKSTGFIVDCQDTTPFGGHRPSVDVLMNSVADQVGADAIGIMLTGMGEDGADGMLAMRQKGSFTIAQDEESSVVFGMPKAAINRGGAQLVVPLAKIGHVVLGHLMR